MSRELLRMSLPLAHLRQLPASWEYTYYVTDHEGIRRRTLLQYTEKACAMQWLIQARSSTLDQVSQNKYLHTTKRQFTAALAYDAALVQ